MRWILRIPGIGIGSRIRFIRLVMRMLLLGSMSGRCNLEGLGFWREEFLGRGWGFIVFRL